MQDWDDNTLLRDYVVRRSEAAFATLVARHVNKVYSVALRHTNNPHSAEEITQAVFVILARKSPHLGRGVILSGWLYLTARLTARTFVRSEIRRTHREQEAHMQTIANQSGEGDWPRIAPLLDTAMAGLGETDRQAVVLHFFDGQSMKEVGVTLGATEVAARKRVNRAVDKLRRFFTKRGILLPAAALAAALSAHSVHAAPVALARSAAAVGLTKGAGGSTLTLVNGALKAMAWTKLKLAVVVGAGILLAAGTATLAVTGIHHYREVHYAWQVENPTPEMLLKIPPLVRIVPTKFPRLNVQTTVTIGSSRILAIGAYMQDALWAAYQPDYFESGHDPLRILALNPLSPAKFDFIANLPSGNQVALQQELRRQFGLIARRETIVTNVLLLQVRYAHASGLEPDTVPPQNALYQQAGKVSFHDQGCRILAHVLGNEFRMPVLDDTGLTNHLFYDLEWPPSRQLHQNQQNLRQALLDQLGLELVPALRPLEMLVVDKAP